MPYNPVDSDGQDEMVRRFGVELRRCRLRAGLSQDSLAEQSGVAQSTISRLERGRAPHAAMLKLVLLSEALGSQLPLAFCPHGHACAWERLDVNGAPVRQPVPLEQEWWFRGRE
jgi:transcriptional regulator with XRE-family HTH domain